MNLTIDERIKHRMVGLAVILSIAAILLPAILKKSSQSLDAMSRVAVRLPSHPTAPTVQAVNEARLFKTMTVAKVKIPSAAPAARVPEAVKVASLKSEPAVVVQTKPVIAMESKTSVMPPSATVTLPRPPVFAANQPKVVQVPHPAQPAVTVSRARPVERVAISHTVSQSMRQVSTAQTGYAVQVASFSSAQNAKVLMNKLQGSGYVVKMAPVFGSGGKVIYKVLVGRAVQREDMVRLQKRLYSQMQLKGFIVSANVG